MSRTFRSSHATRFLQAVLVFPTLACRWAVVRPGRLEIEGAPGGDRSLLSLAAHIEMAIGSIPAPVGFD
jgi:hypothetical protein